MAARSKVPRTTHTWLKPLYNYLDNGVAAITPSGASGIASTAWLGAYVPQSVVGNATGTIGVYGASGILQPTGLGMTGSATLGGPTGTTFFDFRTNGGTGAQYYSFTDIVNILKLRGDIAK